MKKIDCSTKKYPNTFALVDDENFDNLNQWNWTATPGGSRSNTLYAVRANETTRKKTRSPQSIKMHQQLLSFDHEIDHIDGNGLNNQVSNLRKCSNKFKNQQNKTKFVTNTSGFKGVSFDKDRNKWFAQINANGKHYNLGRFDTKEEAAVAYNKKAFQLHEEFARLNEIKHE